MTVRIDISLEAGLAWKVRAIRDRTGQSMARIVKTAIESYYRSTIRGGNSAELLSELIGCSRGSAYLSARYKRRPNRGHQSS